MDKLKILIINNYGQFCHLIHRLVQDLDMNAKLMKNTTTIEDILNEEPDGLILSGGPTMERTGLCAEYVQKINSPILGICLGHQLIAKTYGGEIGKGYHGGYGSVSIKVIEENDILKGLGPDISVWSSHADEVLKLPKDFIQLAKSDICEIEAMKHKDKPLYGVQWHPEVAQTKSGKSLFVNFFKVCKDYKIKS